MSVFDLKSPFKPAGDQIEAIRELYEGFKKGNKKQQTLLGVTGSGKTFTMANLIKKMGKRTLIMAPNKTLVAQLYAEFKEFFPNNAVEYFVSYYDYYQPEAYIPSTDTYIEKDSAINDEIDKLRHSTTKNLLDRDDVIVVASVSCIYNIGSVEEYQAKRVMLYAGDTIGRDEFLRELASIQYTRNDIDFTRGTFRVRGENVEIFPPSEDGRVIRISFFGDEIESISLVDPLRAKVLETLNSIVIYPQSHYVVNASKMKEALVTIKEELRERLKELESRGKLLERQRLEQKTLYDLEMLEEIGFCSGIENYTRHLTGSMPGGCPPSLLEFFKKDFLLIIDESHITIPQIGGMYAGDQARKKTLVEHGFRLPSALDNRPLSFSEFREKIDQVLYVSATPAEYELEQCQGEFIEQVIRPTGLLDPLIEVRDAKTQIDDLLEECKKVILGKERVLVTTLTKKLAEEITDFFSQRGLKVRYLHSDITTLERMEIIRDLRLGEFDILVGINLLREGLDLPEVSLVAILDADKEGFLRSARSLIQTIGRAARNSKGRVILYAYETTRSMKEAIEETKRRRTKQEKYNKEHAIVPKTIEKKVTGGIIETLQRAKGKSKTIQKFSKILENPEEISKRIVELKKLMKEASRDLRFEDAAKYRDEIKGLNELFLYLR